MSIPRPESVPSRHFESWRRISQHCANTGRVICEELGWGNEGLVYSTTSKTAIKAFLHEQLYQNERNVYLRLHEKNVNSVSGFKVPRLVIYDDKLWIVEMTVVSPPFILDFAGAYLDKKPPFAEEQWQQWEEEKAEIFEEKWPQVKSAMSRFRRYGIYLNDVKHGNVMFCD